MGSKQTKVNKKAENKKVPEQVNDNLVTKSDIRLEPVIEEINMNNEEAVINDDYLVGQVNNLEANRNENIDQNLNDFDYQENNNQLDLLNQSLDISYDDNESSNLKKKSNFGQVIDGSNTTVEENDYSIKNSMVQVYANPRITNFIISPRNSFVKISFID